MFPPQSMSPPNLSPFHPGPQGGGSGPRRCGRPPRGPRRGASQPLCAYECPDITCFCPTTKRIRMLYLDYLLLHAPRMHECSGTLSSDQSPQHPSPANINQQNANTCILNVEIPGDRAPPACATIWTAQRS